MNMPRTIHIKNMVCRRCVMTVRTICDGLGLADAKVELGSVTFATMPDDATMKEFRTRLTEVGFEPLDSARDVVIERVKGAVIHYVRNHEAVGMLKLSAYIEDALGMDFRMVSQMFSTSESRTIQNYLMLQRVEYVKELLADNVLTLPEIADRVGFSSVAHMSNSFKKISGMTLSQFRKDGTRTPLDEV